MGWSGRKRTEWREVGVLNVECRLFTLTRRGERYRDFCSELVEPSYQRTKLVTVTRTVREKQYNCSTHRN